MWVLIAMLFLFSGIQYSLALSLYEKKRNALITIILIALGFAVTHIYALEMNNADIEVLLNSYDILAVLATLQIAESIINFLTTLDIIEGHFSKQLSLLKRIFNFLPPIVFVIGLFTLHICLFNKINGLLYFQISIAYAVGFILVISAIVLLLRKIMDWELRLEARVLLSIIQIAIAMFLPVLMLGVNVNGESTEINVIGTFMSLLCMVLLGVCGFIGNKYSIGEKIWNRLTAFFT